MKDCVPSRQTLARHALGVALGVAFGLIFGVAFLRGTVFLLRPTPRTVVVYLALVLQSMALAEPEHALAQEPEVPSVVLGQVVAHESGEPLSGAAVSLASGPEGTRGLGTRVTNQDGRFVFRNVPRGVYRLSVTLLGYADFRDTLRVDPDSELELSLPLSVSPIPLEPLVVVTERRYAGVMQGFEDRREMGFGTFMDREQIERRAPILFTDLFRLVPGARVVPTPPFGNTIQLRGGCRPSLWVDGLQLMTEIGMDQILPPMDVEAVEIYKGPSTPARFQSNACGAIVVWTRRGEPTGGWEGFWRKLGMAVGFVGLAFLLTR